MSVVQSGSINTTALIVPGLYVQIVPPSQAQINGVPTNQLGVVGSAQWGPVNSPTTGGSMQQLSSSFGSMMNRKYDLLSACAAAVSQGANNIRAVRVTDGTDVAASVLMNSGSIASVTLAGTLTGYTGGATIAFPAAPAGGRTATGTVVGTGTLVSVTINDPGAGYLSGPVPTITAVSAGTAATATSTLAVSATGLTITAKYTGTLGNLLTAIYSTGSAVGTYKVSLAIPGIAPEVFDNIGFGLTGNPLLLAMASVINNGNSIIRGPSNLGIASAGAGVGAPVVGTVGQSQILIGGTDGATTITGATLVGSDVTTPRKGMYALRNTGVSVAVLADDDDTTTFSAQVAFGLSEGVYMVGASPAGDNITNAAAIKATAGIDSYTFKYLLGDWVYFQDTVNQVQRLLSPASFVAGLLVNLGPQQSTLNKPIFGIIGTQKSFANQLYSNAELQQLIQAGIDVIANPSPGGTFFGCQSGHNSSSNATIQGDNYTRMTNYIAYTLNAGMGTFVGKLQSQQPNDPLRRAVGATLSDFFANLRTASPPQIDDASVVCDATNNSPARIAAGYLQADVKVRYLAVVEKFLINVEGGQTVTITRTATAPASA